MLPNLYQIIIDGVEQPPMTARQIAQAIDLPASVVNMRLRRGARRLDDLIKPVGVYGGNDGYRKPTWHERRAAARAQASIDRDEQRRIAAAADALADLE